MSIAPPRDTDDLNLGRRVIDDLCAMSSNPDTLRTLLTSPKLPVFGTDDDPGCITYRSPGKERAMLVELRHANGQRVLVSASRIAYAAARAHSHTKLSSYEDAKHLCEGEATVDGVRCPCLNPAHMFGVVVRDESSIPVVEERPANHRRERILAALIQWNAPMMARLERSSPMIVEWFMAWMENENVNIIADADVTMRFHGYLAGMSMALDT